MGIPFGISLFIYGIVPFAAQGQPLYIYTLVAYLETLALTSCLQVRILLCPSSLANRILSPALSRASGSFCLCDQISARASTSAVLPLRVILSRSTQVVTLSQSFPFRSRRAPFPHHHSIPLLFLPLYHLAVSWVFRPVALTLSWGYLVTFFSPTLLCQRGVTPVRG